MAVELKIGIIGAGRIGGNLAIWLKKKGLPISGIFDIDNSKTEKIRHLSGVAMFLSLEQLLKKVDVVLIAIPDNLLVDLSQEIYENFPARAKYFLHTSGINSHYVLKFPYSDTYALSLHPAKSIPYLFKKNNPFKNCIFLAEGDDRIIDIAREIVIKLEGKMVVAEIKSRGKYHSGCCFLSNMLLPNLDSGMKLLQESGLDYKSSKRIAKILIKSVLDNYFQRDGVPSLTGPLTRDDSISIYRHNISITDERIANLYKCLIEQLQRIAEKK